MFITVQDFTGVYAEQPFMQELREKSAKSADIHWLDCTKIVGTDCYCDDDAVKAINEMIDNAESGCKTGCNSIIENRDGSKCCNSSANDIAEQPAIHFFDNGNYHYMSKLWTDRVQEPFSLIVFDHHPDMQPPRFGGILSCGGWVLEVLENNKFIQNVVVIGVADHLADEIREELTLAGNAQVLNKITFVKESELEKEITLSSFVHQRSGLSSNYIQPRSDVPEIPRILRSKSSRFVAAFMATSREICSFW